MAKKLVVQMVKMSPGECKCTRKGAKFCYIAGRGVRFTGKC